jgi:hypothetical protein
MPRKQKRHAFETKRVPLVRSSLRGSAIERIAKAREPKKAASLAIDDWLVFARRGLNSRVQVVLAG